MKNFRSSTVAYLICRGALMDEPLLPPEQGLKSGGKWLANEVSAAEPVLSGYNPSREATLE
jgi:hypothetical protein